MSAGRRWLFRAVALVLVPLVLLAGLEGVLRLAGYGYSTHFFRPLRIGGEEFLVQNDDVGLRFFPPELLRMPPPMRMPAHKPPGVYRIFVFGESAAMGDPDPAFGAARYLQALLRERYPQQQFEVVNVSMTAIDSPVILPIARDCAKEQGDLWIIYMGNNEMVGPFGAATVFGAQAPPLTLIRFELALQRSRLGQALVSLGRKFRGRSAGVSWGGMQMFAKNRVPPGDARREVVYRNFQQNLKDIVRTGLNSGAAVVLSTVAVNLKDCPPFASVDDTNALGVSGAAAIPDECGKFARLHPQSADAQFRWAASLTRAGQSAAAREHYQAACDLDALPFRTDSRLNELIAGTAGALSGPRLVLCDAAAALATSTAAGVPGEESFYEHVHLNFDGNYRLARAWADKVAQLLPAEIANHASVNWAPQGICEQRLGLTDWNRVNVLGEVVRRLRGPPLNGQPNNPERLRKIQVRQAELRTHLDGPTAKQAAALYLEAIKRSPDDFRLHENFADFLATKGDFPAAWPEWERVHELIPQDHVPLFELGRLAARQGRYPEAISWLRRSLALRPGFNGAWVELGKAEAAQGKSDEALEDYNRALALQPQDYQAWFCAGLALSKLNRRPESIEHYRQAVELNPDYWEARFELGGQLGLEGKIDDAKEQLQAAVRLNPVFPMAHLNLGLALMKQGHLDEAQQQFQETLRLDPSNKLAPACLAKVEALRASAR